MIIGIDIDGTLGDYVGAFRQYMISNGLADEFVSFPKQYDFTAAWPSIFRSEEEVITLHRSFVIDGGFLKMNPFPGAGQNIQYLIDQGHHIRIITSRLCGNGFHCKTLSDTVTWLHIHNIPYHDFCAVSDKSHVHFDVLIDDYPKHLHKVISQNRKAIIFDQPYNKLESNLLRCLSWQDVPDMIRNL